MRTPPDTDRSERGTAAVEFALVLPLVLVVALAVVQTGLLVRDRLLVEAAARAGARGLYSPSMLTTDRWIRTR
jgi:Flp pilus assembly protein TadG